MSSVRLWARFSGEHLLAWRQPPIRMGRQRISLTSPGPITGWSVLTRKDERLA
jgi:hypothetical protein